MKNREIENMIEMIVYCCIDSAFEVSQKYFQQRKALKKLFLVKEYNIEMGRK